jgi:hypothetical protein
MKWQYSLAFGFILALLLTGCITVFVPVNTPTPVPTAIVLPTLSPPTETLVPTIAPAQPAPICSVDPFAGACTDPSVGMLNKTCNKKTPYTGLGISAGATLEVLDEGMTCTDEKIWSGVHQFSCTGEQLHSYRVKVCNTSCSVPVLDTSTGRCSMGYGYSVEAGCCLPLADISEIGCVIFKVDIGGCQ